MMEYIAHLSQFIFPNIRWPNSAKHILLELRFIIVITIVTAITTSVSGGHLDVQPVKSTMVPARKVPIIDIRREGTVDSLREDLENSLREKNDGQKTLPTLLLYNEAGLRLFERITYLEEYYLTNAEIEVLEKYADSIAKRIPEGSMVVELGSG
jgi:hypothetical protein